MAKCSNYLNIGPVMLYGRYGSTREYTSTTPPKRNPQHLTFHAFSVMRTNAEIRAFKKVFASLEVSASFAVTVS